MCYEWWDERGYKDNLLGYFLRMQMDYDSIEMPPWIGFEDFHRSHQSNLIRKDPEYYRPLFPNVPDDLPYIWPVRLWNGWVGARGALTDTFDEEE